MFIEKIQSSGNTHNKTPFYPGMSVCRAEEHLYVSGGISGAVLVDQFVAIDTHTHERRTLSPIPFGVHKHRTCIFNNRMYLFGGQRSDESREVVVFDLMDETWERLEIQTSDTVYAAFVHNGRIWVADRESVKVLDENNNLVAIDVHRYKNHGTFVSVMPPKVFFDNFIYDVVAKTVHAFTPDYPCDDYTCLPYLDKLIYMPKRYRPGMAFKIVDQELYSNDLTTGSYEHVLLDDEIFSFNTKTHSWFKSYPFSEQVYHESKHPLSYLNDVVYMSGLGSRVRFARYHGDDLKIGEFDIISLDCTDVSKHRVNARSFSERPSFNMRSTRLAVINDQMYAHGGLGEFHDNGELNDNLYNLSQGTTIKPDIQGRMDHSLSAFNGSLIVAGGRNKQVYNDLHQINPFTGASIKLKRIPSNGLHRHVAAVGDHHLFLAGGQDALNMTNHHVYVYDFLSNSFEILNDVNSGVVHDIVTFGPAAYVLETLGDVLQITKLSATGIINTKRIALQFKKIDELHACKLDSNSMALIVSGICNSEPTTTIYRLGL